MDRSIRVYIVDDHALVREWLGNLLRLQDDMTLVGDAEDADQALSDIALLQADVVVIDLSLRRGSGLDLVRAIDTQGINVRPLIMSMHEDVTDVERALRAGACGYVMKASATSQIVQAIRDVHAGKLFADPTVLSVLVDRAIGRPASRKDPAEILSERELDVFRCLGDGHSTRRIADDMRISQNTVQTYCARIKEKLCIDDGRQLLQAAILWVQRHPRREA